MYLYTDYTAASRINCLPVELLVREHREVSSVSFSCTLCKEYHILTENTCSSLPVLLVGEHQQLYSGSFRCTLCKGQGRADKGGQGGNLPWAGDTMHSHRPPLPNAVFGEQEYACWSSVNTGHGRCSPPTVQPCLCQLRGR